MNERGCLQVRNYQRDPFVDESGGDDCAAPCAADNLSSARFV